MEPITVGLDSWLIQDGNYTDFTAGQPAKFALEFYPHSVGSREKNVTAITLLKNNEYRVCARVIFSAAGAWVIDCGFLAYQQAEPPSFAVSGAWVEVDLSLGVDPFFYFEELIELPGMPPLIYNFFIEQILLDTTPWLTAADELGRTTMIRDVNNEASREIAGTDA